MGQTASSPAWPATTARHSTRRRSSGC